jgi:hypothetical protein
VMLMGLCESGTIPGYVMDISGFYGVVFGFGFEFGFVVIDGRKLGWDNRRQD